MTLEIPDSLINHLRHHTQHVVVLTGAGMSAESQIPTFREAQTGLWARYDPRELATPGAFAHDPKRVWEWYAWRRQLIDQAQPHAGHLALVDMQSYVTELKIVTQNIDGLHQRAGSHSVIELHGNIHRLKCAQNHHPVAIAIPEQLSRCPYCDSLLRPDVVWFGESLPIEAFKQAVMAIEHCRTVFSIGTSNQVQPAASLPFVALNRGATVVEINPQPTPLTPHAHYVLQGAVGDYLPQLVQCTWQALN